MALEFRELRQKDHEKAIKFAVAGMHFDWYLSSKILQSLYGRYFWYQEMLRATQILAVYEGDTFAGVLLAEMRGEEAKHRSPWKRLYVEAVEFVQRVFFKGSVGVYDETNRQLLNEYLAEYDPDGEIIFLAANPDVKIKGIGTALLNVFEQREKGKTVYLYTDDACTYQFYENRGFERVGEKNIVLTFDKKEVDLKCLLYSKEID